MRAFIYSALTVVTFGLFTLAPASANWSCIGPAVACSDAGVSPYRSQYRRSTERFDSERTYRRQANTSKRAKHKAVAKLDTVTKPDTVAKVDVPAPQPAKRADHRNVAQNGRAPVTTNTAKVELPERKPTGVIETKTEATYRVTSSQTGMASYYGSESGSQTASGARFNPRAMTAAHRSLPFGTKVRVTNKRNGKSVIVTINDRGPFIRGRIIDLSTSAAGVIDMRSAGVAPVLVERLGG
jgi:rare lipoprotein A